MPAYDPKRPRPSASRAEEPAPVEALLEPADAAPVASAPQPGPASSAPEAAPSSEDAPSSDDLPTTVEETPAPDADEAVDQAADEADEIEAVPAPRDAEDVEVDLRDVSSNGSHAGSHEVPVAPAPNEVTANRAVLVAGISAAALVALIVAVLLRRRRRSD